KAVPDFVQTCLRVRRNTAFLVFDAVESCYISQTLGAVAQAITALTAEADSPWQVILTCQTPGWLRVSQALASSLAGHPVLTQLVECNELLPDDFEIVRHA